MFNNKSITIGFGIFIYVLIAFISAEVSYFEQIVSLLAKTMTDQNSIDFVTKVPGVIHDYLGKISLFSFNIVIV